MLPDDLPVVRVLQQGVVVEAGIARLALERALSHDGMAEAFARQVNDQSAEADALRTTYNKLQQKLNETRSTCEMLIAQHRRARSAGKANAVRGVSATSKAAHVLGRLRSTIQMKEASNSAGHLILESETVDDRLDTLEREDRIEHLLEDLKSRQPRLT